VKLSQATWVWIGLIIGVSFIATPAKFLAPSLSLPGALEVGRVTFGVFKWVEVVAFAGLLVFAWSHLRSRTVQLCVAGIALMLIGQYVWLLPILDARVELILNGAQPPESSLHTVYILVELAKIALLILLGVAGRWSETRSIDITEGA